MKSRRGIKDGLVFVAQRNFILAIFVAYIYYICVNHYQVTAKMLNNLMPDNFDYWAAVAQDQASPDIGQFKQSTQYYYKLVKLFAEDTAAMNMMGYIYFYSGEWEKAKKMYLQSARVNPADGGTQYNLGQIYFLQKNYPKAEEYFKRYLVSSSEASIQFIYSARAYLPIRKSIPQFERFIEKKKQEESNWASSLLALSVYLKNFPEFMQGRYSVDSRLNLQDYIYCRLGQEALEFKQYSAAVGFFQESLNRNPDYLPTIEGLTLALQKLGKMDMAAKLIYKGQSLKNALGESKGKERFLQLQIF